jgi:phage terminase large subunit GpA-like protein
VNVPLWGLSLFLLPAVPLLADKAARARGWRLGSWTGRWWRRRWQWCSKCGTSYRYTRPHVTRYARTEAGVRITFPLCEKCWAPLTPQQRMEYYARLWLDRHETAKARGEQTDVREWEEIKAAVRIGA